MNYAIDLLYKERDRLIDLRDSAKNGDESNWDWTVIINSENKLSVIVDSIQILEENICGK